MVVAMCCREGKSDRALDLARRRSSGSGDSDGSGLDRALEGHTRPGLGTVLSSSVMHHSSHQGAVAAQNPGGRDSLGPASWAGRSGLCAGT